MNISPFYYGYTTPNNISNKPNIYRQNNPNIYFGSNLRSSNLTTDRFLKIDRKSVV